MKTKYRVRNNTDYSTSFYTNNKKEAEKLWRKIRLNANAGNLYFAVFEELCPKCEQYYNINDEYAHICLI